jgi:hypothetical protein
MSARQAACELIMPRQTTLNGCVLDRRSFLGALSLAAAGSLLASPGWTAAASHSPDTTRLSLEPTAEAGTWHVDDMWGHMPRYAHPIPYSPSYPSPNWDNVDPIDRAFVT